MVKKLGTLTYIHFCCHAIYNSHFPSPLLLNSLSPTISINLALSFSLTFALFALSLYIYNSLLPPSLSLSLPFPRFFSSPLYPVLLLLSLLSSSLPPSLLLYLTSIHVCSHTISIFLSLSSTPESTLSHYISISRSLVLSFPPKSTLSLLRSCSLSPSLPPPLSLTPSLTPSLPPSPLSLSLFLFRSPRSL